MDKFLSVSQVVLAAAMAALILATGDGLGFTASLTVAGIIAIDGVKSFVQHKMNQV